MAGFLSRSRASAYMKELGLDAMVLTQPESIIYATGCHPGVAAIPRRAAAGLVLVPANAEAPLAAVVGDGQTAEFSARSGIADVRGHTIWFDSATMPAAAGRDQSAAGTLIGLTDKDGKPARRPAQFEPELALRQLKDILVERGLDKSAIGLELAFVPVLDMPFFERELPKVRWKDASLIVCKLRSIKMPEEIELLRRAAYLSDRGMYHLRERITEGHRADDMIRIWREGCSAAADKDGREKIDSTWAFVSVGPTAFAAGGPFQKGDVVRLDLGVVIRGYSSDVGRTWALGESSVAQRSVFDSLYEAFQTCLPLIKPGTPMADIHRTATGVMHRKGFTSYGRGHFGHGVGASVFSEEWPFLGPDEEGVLEENMVIAFETPYYINGLGNFIVEDQMVITPGGHETMYTFERGLTRIDK